MYLLEATCYDDPSFLVRDKMRRIVTVVSFSLVLSFYLQAQDQASMTAPLVMKTLETVSVSARFSDFVSGNDYRLGVGTDQGQISNATIELVKNDTVVQKKLLDFEQRYCSHWWDIDQISMQGFVFSSAETPEKDESLTMRVTIPKAAIGKINNLYILIAKKYGEDRWYIEDGGELSSSDW